MHYSGFSIVMYGERTKSKIKNPIVFFKLGHELRVRVKLRLKMLPTVLNIAFFLLSV